MTEFPEDSPQPRGERETEDWLRRELAFLHGVERRVVRRARAREEVWRAGAVALILVMFASCWYLAALSSSGQTGTACPLVNPGVSVAADAAPAGAPDGGADGSGFADGTGSTVSDAAVAYRSTATAAGGIPPDARAQPIAPPGRTVAGGTAPSGAAAGDTPPGAATHPGSAKPAGARGPLRPHPGAIRPRKAVKPAGVGGREEP